MTGKNTAPDVLAEALSMRAAGYTTIAISQKLGISARTLARHFAKHGTTKGSALPEVIEASRSELLALITSDDRIRQEVAQHLHDDLAHVKALRETLHATLSKIDEKPPTTLDEVALAMRALVAYSTALRNTSDVWRHGLRLDKRTDDDKPLPELVISELTEDQITQLRQREFNPYDGPDVAQPCPSPDQLH